MWQTAYEQFRAFLGRPIATRPHEKLWDSGFIALGDGKHGALSPSIIVSGNGARVQIGPCFIGDGSGTASPVEAEVRTLWLSRRDGSVECIFMVSISGQMALDQLDEACGGAGSIGMVGLKCCHMTRPGTPVSTSQST